MIAMSDADAASSTGHPAQCVEAAAEVADMVCWMERVGRADELIGVIMLRGFSHVSATA